MYDLVRGLLPRAAITQEAPLICNFFAGYYSQRGKILHHKAPEPPTFAFILHKNCINALDGVIKYKTCMKQRNIHFIKNFIRGNKIRIAPTNFTLNFFWSVC